MAQACKAPTADAWQLAAATAARQVDELTSAASRAAPAELRVLRSSQADALRLDGELNAMLREQLVRLFEHFTPAQAARVEPEVNALLSLLVFALSVWPGRATPGSELLNLRYRNERAVAAAAANGGAAGAAKVIGASGVGGPGLTRAQRLALGLGSVVLPYAWSRLCRTAHAAEWPEAEAASWRRRAWRAMAWAEGLLQGASLVNSWAFLVRGDYRTLLERLVGARLVWRQAAMTRVISFEYLNRQLLWQELAEALLLLLPLVDMARLRGAAMRLLPRPQTAAVGPGTQAGAAAAAGAKGTGSGSVGDEVVEGPVRCPVCGDEDILTAVQALPCGHVFCYYCLRSSTAADVRYCCPLDGLRVGAMRRWRGGKGAGAGPGEQGADGGSAATPG